MTNRLTQVYDFLILNYTRMWWCSSILVVVVSFHEKDSRLKRETNFCDVSFAEARKRISRFFVVASYHTNKCGEIWKGREVLFDVIVPTQMSRFDVCTFLIVIN